jgi:heme/copper-type cytochrome/quinol oxidase subunit 2
MHGLLGFLLADAASEGRSVVTAMLLVGLIFIGVIALGELTHWAGSRRKARKATRKPY